METQPEKIGRYAIESTVGHGAMGVVYKAKDPLIGRTVAIKTVTLSGLLSQEQLEEFKVRFFREAQAAGVLHHPNIVTIHDVGEQDGMPFMAMEFVDGVSLSRRIKEEGRIPAQEAVLLVRQVALGLAFAHERGIVHRDIKPDNILLDSATGRAVIADFGVAHVTSSELTRTGEVLGTPYFMSPEQVLGNPLDGRSDLFSLGVVLYLMLTGKRPFRGDTVSSVCYHIVHGQAEPLPPDPGIPPGLAAVLDRALAKSADDRYPDGYAFVEALDAALVETCDNGAQQTAAADMTTDLSAYPADLSAGTGAATLVQPDPATQAGYASTLVQPVQEGPSSSRGLLVAALVILGLTAVVAAFILGVVLAAGGGKKGGKPAPGGKGAVPGTSAGTSAPNRDIVLAEKGADPKEEARRQAERLQAEMEGSKAGAAAKQQPAAAVAPVPQTCPVTVIFETRFPEGRFVLELDGRPVVEIPYAARRAADGRGGFRGARTVELPVGSHVARARVTVSGPNGAVTLENSRPLDLTAGRPVILGVEARRFPPPQIVIRASQG